MLCYHKRKVGAVEVCLGPLGLMDRIKALSFLVVSCLLCCSIGPFGKKIKLFIYREKLEREKKAEQCSKGSASTIMKEKAKGKAEKVRKIICAIQIHTIQKDIKNE